MGQPFWNVPHPRNPTFTGRKDILADLRKRLTKRGRTALAQAISGLGGIGKTQAAVEYAHCHHGKYQAVLWLNAESPLELKAGCGDIARRLHLPYPEDDLDQTVMALKLWLETHRGWLLILDNADDPANLKPFLSAAENGHILITSRAQDFQALGILDPIELPNLPLDDATEFLLRRCRRPAAEAEERNAARDLARVLDGLPLALEQAAAYMVETKASFRRYLEGYRRRGLELLDARCPALGGYSESVVSTWAANFAAVREESPAAADVLRFSAFLAPDDIPFELLSRGAPDLGPLVAAALTESEADSLQVNDLLRPLARFSLIRIAGEREAYGLHRLVQEVLKEAMDGLTRREWSERVVRAVWRVFSPVGFGNWPQCEQLLPHALAVASEIEREGIQAVEAGRLLHATAGHLEVRSQYAEAESLYRQATEINRTALGERHPAYAASLNSLASLYDAMGRHAEAEPLYREVMEIRRTALGERHPSYATSLDNLAFLYREMGRHAEAEPLYREAMELRREALGERHPDYYAASLNNLASLYDVMGRHAEAESLYREAMEITRTALGERHPDYAAWLSNLAELYRAMGRHADAEPLYHQAVSIFRSTMGTSYLLYQTVLTNYIVNQQEGGLPLPDRELLEVFLESPPSPPPETGAGYAGPEGLGP